jgi:hypothetical protein
MDLRDYFAAKAMQGIIIKGTNMGYEYIPEMAYDYADAMMKVREQK